MKYSLHSLKSDELGCFRDGIGELEKLIVNDRLLTADGFTDDSVRREVKRVVDSLEYRSNIWAGQCHLSMSAFILRGENAALIITPHFTGPLNVEHEGYFVPNELLDTGYGFPEDGLYHHCENKPTIKSHFSRMEIQPGDDPDADGCGYSYAEIHSQLRSMYIGILESAPELTPRVSIDALELRESAAKCLSLALLARYPSVRAAHVEEMRISEENETARKLKAKEKRDAKRAEKEAAKAAEKLAGAHHSRN